MITQDMPGAECGAKERMVNALEAALIDFGSFPRLRHHLSALPLSPHVHLLAIGKSASSMARIAREVLCERGITCEGFILTKYGYAPESIGALITLEAGHPLPDANSLWHSTVILNWLQQLPRRDTLIVLLSGGGSALFEVPEAGYSLDELIELNRNLLKSGLDIAAMNLQRARFSKVKGGKALHFVACEQIQVYALSDVEGNDPRVIASGPFTPVLGTDNRIKYHIIGDNYGFRQVLKSKLPGPVTNLHEYLALPAHEAAAWLDRFIHQAHTHGTYLLGGEAPVQTAGTGQGGRCTHLALDVAIRIAGKAGISLLCYASDGCDNIEGVAGAYVTGDSYAQLQSKGLDPESYLHDCDSYTALQAIGAILGSSTTRLNVNDIYILYRY